MAVLVIDYPLWITKNDVVNVRPIVECHVLSAIYHFGWQKTKLFYQFSWKVTIVAAAWACMYTCIFRKTVWRFISNFYFQFLDFFQMDFTDFFYMNFLTLACFVKHANSSLSCFAKCAWILISYISSSSFAVFAKDFQYFAFVWILFILVTTEVLEEFLIVSKSCRITLSNIIKQYIFLPDKLLQMLGESFQYHWVLPPQKTK